MLNEVKDDVLEKMETSLESLQEELSQMRTGRASTSLVDKMRIDYYGTPTILQQLALISTPEPQLIAIRPFDPSSINTIQKAIMQSDLGIMPSSDGKVIRLAIPALTEERRRSIAKSVQHRIEEARVSIRNHRRDSLATLKDMEKEKMISEDDFYRAKEEIQKLTDDYIKQVEEAGQEKQDEIMSL
jgi:ribosome recycling factor